jgi:peptide/nickel transport system substrate-binding protein
MRDPKLRDVRVRRAIAMAIDREGIIRTILRGTARVATGILSPENWAYEGSVSTYAYNPEASRNLLDDAGYVSKDGAPRFTLVFKTTPDEQRRRLAQAIQAMLGAVGIRVEIRTNEWATFYSDIQRGNFDLTTMAWIGINDPHHYFMIFDSKMTPPRGQNRGFYSNPEMDSLVEAGDQVMDAQARRAIYSKVQKLAALDLAYVSLWWLDNVAVMNREVMGFRHYPNGSLLSFADLTLENRMATVAPSQ